MPAKITSHDLHLPNWGPYSKRYAGISHIPDVNQGLRFDVGIIPGHYRRQMLVPNEKWASGHFPWEAVPDLSYYAYRYELEWKDQVYCDVSFSAISDHARLLRSNFVNTTDSEQNLMVHLVAFMNFPPVRPYSDEPIQIMKVTLPKGGLWFGALDYEELIYAVSRPTDNLVEDGMLRAEIRAHGLVDGSGIGCGFGKDTGDMVHFRFALSKGIPNATVTFRYKLDGDKPLSFLLSGSIQGELVFSGEKHDGLGFSCLSLNVGRLEPGDFDITLTSQGGIGVVLDGFAITNAVHVDEICFEIHKWTHTPQIMVGPHPQSVILKFADTDVYYGLAWDLPDFWIRQILNDELDNLLRWLVPNNYSEIIEGSGEGHFTDIFLRPIFLSPHSEKMIFAMTCFGSQIEVEGLLSDFHFKKSEELEQIYIAAREKTDYIDYLPSSEKYRFSQERMAATELMNVVYPVYTRRQYIRHNTPGKWWDCLYTWDSGFIGLALLELDQQRAIDCLNAYLTPAGDTHAAFIHHGSPVPTQMYLFHELWNRTQDRTLLESFYPKLRQYYLFLAGRSGSSTTRGLQSNLLRTWEYFFESGGWDDYPAQIYTLEGKGEAQITCVAITSHAIRSAKILAEAAKVLGLSDDEAIYNEDISIFSDALQRYAWDEDSGYFSYVCHNEAGVPIGHLRNKNGINYNMGLDGITPLQAGICTTEQEKLFWDRLKDTNRFWTKIGLSTVDQSAPYYRNDGYWNGAVWMPHQWFIWKTALDLGQGEFANKIANTALDLWKTEVETSYYCFEHFLIQSGRGAGWHQFSGLSSPVVSWFGAYHRPGRLTTGSDIWVEEVQFTNFNRCLFARLRRMGHPRSVSLIVNMQPGFHYSAKWNGQSIGFTEINSGSFQIEIPFDSHVGMIEFFLAEKFHNHVPGTELY